FGWQGGSYEQNFRAHESLDVENTITVPLREAYEGTQKSIRIAGEEVLQFSIPAGIQPDERICLRARGRMGKSGRRGDRYLRIAFSADDQMTLEGLDIHMTRDIMPWDAALGATLDILPLTQHLRVKVKPGTRSGVKLRLAGQGYRDKQGRRGDLYLTLVVQNPAHLTPELTTLYQQAAEAAASPPTSRERNGR
ncbi:MAG: J domain-containing protein, partial [Clostridia bacterium]